MTRKYIGKKKTYRVDDSTYKSFQNWCSRRGLDVSTAIRGSMGLLMRKGSVEELLKDSEMKSLAIEVLNKIERSNEK